MSDHYASDYYGTPALRVPGPFGTTAALPYVLGSGAVRAIARRIADSITEDARNQPGPVVWVTGNSYLPPLRSITEAEHVYQAENNDDGDLFAYLVDLVEQFLTEEDVFLDCPDYDNSLFAVDLRRWQFKGEDGHDDINDEWEPVTTETGRFTRGPEPAAATDR